MEVITDRIKLSITKQEYDNHYENFKDILFAFGCEWYVEQLNCDSSRDPTRPKYTATLRKAGK